MNRSRRSSHASVRPSSPLLRADDTLGHVPRAARLTSAAGRPRASIEPLEPRQLLFSLTVSQPGEIVEAFFGYTIPFLGPAEDIEDVEVQDPVIEDFNDVDLNNDGNAPDLGPVPPGTVFPDSRLRVDHTILPFDDFRLQLNPDDDGDARIFTRMDPGETLRFRFADEEADDVFVGVESFSFRIIEGPNGGGGLPIFDDVGNPNMRVELLLQGELIETFSGQDLADAGPGGTPPGVGTFFFQPGPDAASPTFDEVRISVTDGPNAPFFIDDAAYTPLQGRFADIVDSRVFGAHVAFSGPVGSSVEFKDLNGEDMIQTLALGIPDNSNFALVDLNDDGVPEFNDGIGSITLRDTDETSVLQIWGGNIESNGGDPADDADFTQSGFDFFNADSILGLYDDFEEAGFGYIAVTDGDDTEFEGLPPGPGSVIIGSPFVRDNSSAEAYNPDGFAIDESVFGAQVVDGFNRVDQGIFVIDGNEMGAVSVHGIVHGSSVFTGAVSELNFGNLVGSVTVNGDLGTLTVGSDAGLWVPDPGLDLDGVVIDQINVTDAQLVVGRTVGEIAIAGRSALNVTVVGDLNDSAGKPPRDVFRHLERERVFGINTDSDVQAVIDANATGSLWEPFFLGINDSFEDLKLRPAHVFGDGFFRNDSVLSAEFVGSAASAVEITGSLGFADPVNTFEDAADVFAFPADGSTPIVVELDSFTGAQPYFRIIDQDGRTLAAVEGSPEELADFVRLEFTPDTPGIYYLAVSSLEPFVTDADMGTQGFNYILTMSGMAPVSLGAYRTGANNGATNATEDINTVTLLSGSLGSVRVGTAYEGSDGGERDPSEILNTDEDELDNLMDFRGGTFSTAGSLFNITTGSDFGDNVFEDPVNFVIGGDLGTVVTGLSTQVGNSPEEGDLGAVNLQVGGSIAMLDIRGGIGIDQDDEDADVPPILPEDSVNISTGLNGDNGDIGMIRVGSHVGGDTMNVVTSPGSIIGGFLVSQDIDFDRSDPDIGVFGGTGVEGLGVDFSTGAGSDVRFVDFPEIDLLNSQDAFQSVLGGSEGLVLTDDAGGSVRITVENTPNGAVGAQVRVLPIDDSQGVAIAEITVDLQFSGAIRIESLGSPNNTDVISIGRIRVLDPGGTDASVIIDGPTQIDVRLIESNGPLDAIVNRTPDGDIVAIDVDQLNVLEIDSGDLGRTQVVEWGPALIGPRLGINNGTTNLDPLVVNQTGADGTGLINGFWNGGTFRPINNVTFGSSFLDDVGSPIDPFLDGLVVRNGSLQAVRVGGAVGDVIVQAGDLVELEADFDNATPAGEFDGIVGTVYANTISMIDVGDGLQQRSQSPLSSSGIFANDDIFQIDALDGASLSSSIMAADDGSGGLDSGDVNGIGNIDVTGGGRFDEVHIGAMNLDQFWNAFVAADVAVFLADIGSVTGTGADLFRSNVFGENIDTVTLGNGFFDASTLSAGGQVDLIEAKGFRNSTLEGGDLEFTFNRITVAESLGMLRATGTIAVDGEPVDDPVGIGDVIDLDLDVVGSVTGSLMANNFTRAQINVANEIALLDAADNIRASDIVAGRAEMITVGANIRTSTISVSGPIINLMVADNITNTDIAVTGPDGRIENITTTDLLSGTISASGPIGTVRVTQGDMVARITTTTDEGDVGLLDAARDLVIQTDISGQLGGLMAGRHIGDRDDPGVILIRGDLASVNAGGQLYSDLRVGESVTGTVSVGPVVNKVGQSLVGNGSVIAFGSINSVVAVGDFGGSVVSFSGGIGSVRVIDGSFLPGREVRAEDGNIDLVEITRGHLLGDVHADFDIGTVRVQSNNDTFGDIGVNPALSNGVAFDELRNQLPPGVFASAAIDGPRITAGGRIGKVAAPDGGVYEAFIHAATFFANVTIGEDVGSDPQTLGTSTVIAAGNKLNFVTIGGDVTGTIFMGGVTDFGADGQLGGTGVNADRVKRGFIRQVFIDGDATNVDFTSGMSAGADGVYNTADDLVEFGKSRTNTIQIDGALSNVQAFSDAFVNAGNNITPGVQLKGTSRPVDDPQIAPGIPAGAALLPMDGSPFAFSFAGGSGTISFTDSGAAPLTGAYWDASTGTLSLIKTSKFATVVVNSDSGPLSDFDIVSNDDASVGTIDIRADLTDDSDIVIDNKLRNLFIQDFSGGGTIRAGGDLLTFQSGSFLDGTLIGHFTRDFSINGNFGSPDDPDAAVIDLISAENVTVTGTFAGGLDVDRRIGLFQPGSLSTGPMDRGVVRVGKTAGDIDIASMNRSRVTVDDAIGSITVGNDMVESSIVAGGDVGKDLAFDKPSSPTVGPTVDRTGTGSIGMVDIDGDVIRSDIVAGIMRGEDGFFGTPDDTVAGGRSTIGMINIAGDIVGSNLNSQSYLIAATGDLAGGLEGDIGNVQIGLLDTLPLPIEVVDLRVVQDALIFTANIEFNQPMNEGTIGDALTVSEVRDGGLTTLTLVEGLDYTVEYDPEELTARVIFSQTVTSRDLPQLADQPGPGVYRFSLDSSILRAQVQGARLDADGDGFATGGEIFSIDDIVGDAGDRIDAEIITSQDFLGNDATIDLYGATDLNLVLDSNTAPDGLPDPNREFTLRGFLGDHPDHDVTSFSFSSDVDIFRINLQAGQILRLGAQSGGAQFAARALLDSDGNPLAATVRSDSADLLGLGDGLYGQLPFADLGGPVLSQLGTISNELIRLPDKPVSEQELTTEDQFLIKQTGTYFLVVSNTDQIEPGAVTNVPPVPGGVGNYQFTIEVFDDSDSGFTGGTDAGDGTPVVSAPAPIQFAGPDGAFGTSDDRTTVQTGDFVFTLDVGPDGVPDTSDDLVSGSNGRGILSTRTGEGVLNSTISSSIGPALASGVPTEVAPDFDVFHLNGRQPLQPGTQVRATVRLTQLGTDLGTRTQGSLEDFSGTVQFALFDTTDSSSIQDASLVFSPSDFSPTGQIPGIVADNGQTRYGYDEQGDFFIEFLTPGRLGAEGAQPATYAITLQGAFNADYTIELQTQPGTQPLDIQPQNIFIETGGGTVDWLEVAGQVTDLTPYTASVVGFNGKIDGKNVDQIILDSLVQNLQNTFAAAGVPVNISTNVSDFEFQDFSTVFLTGDGDPLNFFNDRIYGASQHADALNADPTDEAVVFVPSLGILGLTPSDSDVEQFADSLSAAVGRRIGELLGLRLHVELNNPINGAFPIQAANSPELFGLPFRFADADIPLSTQFDTQSETAFFLGEQNSESLLDQILGS